MCFQAVFLLYLARVIPSMLLNGTISVIDYRYIKKGRGSIKREYILWVAIKYFIKFREKGLENLQNSLKFLRFL